MTRPDGVTLADPRIGAPARVRRASLRIVSGPDADRVIEVPDSGVLIGTQPPADLVLADPNVSRSHAEVRRAPNGWVLTDLSSRNGTFVDDLRVNSAYLGSGVIFRVGKTAIAFEAREEDLRIDPSAPAAAASDLVAQSPAMRAFVSALGTFAPTDLSVVLEGETGAGKELAARSLHRASARAPRPFVVVDCGALQENLVESELFGHERGAFTGAVEARAGAFELADGGTIFLDEVGEIPLPLQPKLLRALEAREVRRLGSNRVLAVDVRVVAATNRDLGVEVAEKRFRPDLFFRLSEVRLRVPSLRERPEDIEPLVRELAQEARPGAVVLPETIDKLRTRAWPGNVRELGNVVRRAVVVARGAPVAPEHLSPADLVEPGWRGPSVPVDTRLPVGEAREVVLAAFHRVYFEALLAEHGGDLDAVAAHAGVHVQSVRRALRGVREK